MPFFLLELFDANVNSFSKLRRMQWLGQGTMPLHFDEHHHNVHLTNGQEMVSSAVSPPTKDKFKPLAKQPDGMKEYG
jgi:hypothetical protein